MKTLSALAARSAARSNNRVINRDQRVPTRGVALRLAKLIVVASVLVAAAAMLIKVVGVRAVTDADATAPGDPVVGVAATPGSPTSTLATAGGGSGNAYPTAESPANAIDDNTGDKYLNFGKTDVGLIVTAQTNGPLTVVHGLRFTAANDAPERDPLTVTLEGTNDLNATTTLNSTWTQIYSGVTGLGTDPGRGTAGTLVSFTNTTAYRSYRLLVTSVRNPGTSNSMQFAEVELTHSTTVNKQLYLRDPGQGLNRIDPVAANDTTTSSVAVVPVPSAPGAVTATTTFTQTAAMTSPFVISAGGPVKVTTYIQVTSGSLPAVPNLNVQLGQGGNAFLTIATSPTVTSLGGNAYKLEWTGSIPNDVTVPAGGQISLTLIDFDSTYSFNVLYDSTTDPSQVQIATTTAIAVDSLGVYDAAYPGGSPRTTTPAGAAYVRFTVSDPFGASDINGADLVIKNSSNGVVLSTTLTNANVVASTGGSKTYEAAWTPPACDTFTINVTAHEGTEGVTAAGQTTLSSTPIPVNDASSVSEDSGVSSINVLANDTKDGSSTITSVTQGAHGAVAITGGGTGLSYAPAADYNGPDTFTYTLSDACGSGTANVNITITPVADTPSVTNASTTVNAQTTSGLVISRNAADSTEVTHFKITNITGGTLFQNDGTSQINNNNFITFAQGNAGLKFTPALNSNTSGSFQVQASLSNANAGLGGNLATATIDVNCGPTFVTNSSDSGAGSLRDIILHACPGATITFDTGPGKVTSPITLTSGELAINKSLTIQGPGVNVLTLSGNNASRIFDAATSGITFSIADLTVSNGRGPAGAFGGGVRGSAGGLTLNLTNCAITNNHADNAGGIAFSGAALNATNCTISGNTSNSFYGGVFILNAPAYLTNCTISGNQANNTYGGVGVIASAGVAALTMTNCTVANNTSTSGAAGIGTSGQSNGNATTTLRNTLVASNTGGAGNFNTSASSGSTAQLTSQGNNLDTDGSSGFVNGVNGNKVGTSGSPLNALLALLADNGGPTQTHALLPGSPALDAGNNCVTDVAHCGDPNIPQLTNDQRGAPFARMADGPDADTTATVDIGAFEAQVSVEDITDKTMNEDAQLQVTFNLGGAANVTSVTAMSSNTTLVPNDPVNNIVLTGSGSTRTLMINPAANQFGTSTITVTVNGANSQSMADTFVLTVNPLADTPSVTNATTTVNTQTTSGLVISRNAGDGTEVTHFKITGITGGTLFQNNGTTQINNNNFITFAQGNAGLKFTPALNSNTSGSFQVQASLSNANAGLGGNLAMATITVNCGPTVVTNSSDSGAGSLRDIILHACPGATITFDMGPGKVTSPITLTSGELAINKSLTIQGPGVNLLTLSGNNASRIFNAATSGITFSLADLTVSNGRGPAGAFGGGVRGSASGLTLNLTNCAITGNHADNAGGIAFSGAALNATNCTISGNTSNSFYGGVFILNAPAFLTNCTISGNHANNTDGGVGVIASAGVAALTMTNCTVANNTGTAAVGGILTNGSSNGSATTTLRNTLVANNTGGQGNFETSFSSGSSAQLTSQGNNLDTDGSSGFANGVNGDKVGTSGSPINAFLGSLADNGGPTQTHALLPGSPALDAGNNCVTDAAHCGDAGIPQLTTDQRGLNRQVGSAVDIGAFESRGFTVAATSGSGQSAVFNTAFSSPLLATVSSAFGEPVSGGQLTFTAPGSGASATFTGGVTTLNAAINASGQASVTATANAIAGGPYNVNGTASGINSPASFSLTNLKANTATAVASSVNPSDFGQSVTFTATVSSGAGTPTGTMQFKDNGANLGAVVALNASGVAQLTTSTLSAGNHPITADYSGAGNFNISSGTLTGGQVVKAQPTFSINDVTQVEGDSGTTPFTFTVTLSAASSLTAKIDFATADGTATTPSDYLATNGTLTFNPGDLTKTVSVTVNGDVTSEPDEAFTVNLSNAVNAGVSKASGTGTIQNDDPAGGVISMSKTDDTVSEANGFITVTIVRTKDVSKAVTVDYLTDDTGAATNCAVNNGLASSRCDFSLMLGTLNFAANETQKTIDIPINRDGYVEGPEAFKFMLSNPTGGAILGVSSSLNILITDSVVPSANAIDDTDLFVRQQYHDFLNREPDAAGLAFWKDNIDKCMDPTRLPAGQTVAQCLQTQRIITSAAFFLSIEFRQTGGLVRDFYVASLDRPATGNLPNLIEFTRDTQAIQRGVVVNQGNWQAQLSANQTAFMNDFVTRPEFVGLYPTTDTPAQYVDKLYMHANVTPGSAQERTNAIAEFGGAATAADAGARGRALLRITQNTAFRARELNRAFVHMEYLGYLRRNPNDSPDGNFSGYNFWLNKLVQFNGDFLQAEMVKAFLTSGEYRGRFGP